MKTCSKCLEEKSLTEFNKYSRSKDGRNGVCRVCTREQNRLYRNALKEKNSKRTIEEIRLTTPTKKCTKCKETKTSDNFNRCNLYGSGLQEKCRSCDNKWVSEWDKANAEAVKKKQADWYKNNPDKVHAKRTKRRLLKSEAYVEHVEISVLRERDGDNCIVCKEPIDFSLSNRDPMMVSLEHVVPLSKGGTHSYDNTALSHLRCNMSKGVKLLHELEVSDDSNSTGHKELD